MTTRTGGTNRSDGDVFTIPYFEQEFRYNSQSALGAAVASGSLNVPKRSFDKLLLKITVYLCESLFASAFTPITGLMVKKTNIDPFENEPVFVKVQGNRHLLIVVHLDGLQALIAKIRRHADETNVVFDSPVVTSVAKVVRAATDEDKLKYIFERIDSINDSGESDHTNAYIKLTSEDRDKLNALYVICQHACKHALEFYWFKQTDYMNHNQRLFQQTACVDNSPFFDQFTVYKTSSTLTGGFKRPFNRMF